VSEYGVAFEDLRCARCFNDCRRVLFGIAGAGEDTANGEEKGIALVRTVHFLSGFDSGAI
jgi:hypothetical protein